MTLEYRIKIKKFDPEWARKLIEMIYPFTLLISTILFGAALAIAGGEMLLYQTVTELTLTVTLIAVLSAFPTLLFGVAKVDLARKIFVPSNYINDTQWRHDWGEYHRRTDFYKYLGWLD